MLATSAALAQHALVVFGSGLRPDGSPGRQLTRRLQATLALARKEPRAPIIVTGGSVTARVPEGRVMQRWLVRRGVKPQRIVVEPRARHTGENADLSVPLLRQLGATSATVVTSRYHARRAKMHLRWALRQAGLSRIKVTAHGAPDGMRPLQRLGAWLRESGKMLRDASFRLRDARRRAGRAPARLPAAAGH